MESYERTLDWLYSLEKSKGIELKLERVRAALAELGDPQRALRCFHVAGTNGKGSVVAFLASILGEAGHRVGIYTSPHLVELAERIRIGSVAIERSQIVALTAEIRERVIDRGIALTFFEVLTAMAFLYFARAEVDFVALEVGLGGRLDATNVVDPIATVITSIGIDHTEFLGTSLREIAFEKAGIIKAGRPVIVGPVGSEAGAVIESISRDRGARVYRAGGDFEWGVGADGCATFDGIGRHLGGLEIGLAGGHQRANAAIALATLAAVADGVVIEEAAMRRGLRNVRWPGRLETVLTAPHTILDGAHNVEAMRALVAELAEIAARRRVHVLFAAMGDKQWPDMIDVLAPHCASALVTEVIPERAAPVDRLQAAFARHCPTSIERDPRVAFGQLLAAAGVDDVVVVTGSLFLVGKVLEILRDGRPASAAR